METNCTFLNTYQQVVRSVSLKMLGDISFKQDISVLDMPESTDFTPEQPVVQITVNTEKELHFTFAAYFTGGSEKFYVSAGLGCTPEEVTESMSTDLAGEFCNLTAGLLKATLEHAEGIDSSVKIGLPEMATLADVLALSEKDNTKSDRWVLSLDNQLVVCTSVTEVLEPAHIESLTQKVSLPPAPVFSEGGILLL